MQGLRQGIHFQRRRTGIRRDCRDKRRRNRDGGEHRQMFTVICADCGKETEVPFEPRNERPVYCRDCFSKHRPARA